MSDEAKETQLQEIEALECIYTDELNVECREYPNICLEITVPALEDSELFTLKTTLPSDYPNTQVPKIEVVGLYDKEDFWGYSSSQIHRELRSVAEENLGMPMVFTLAKEALLANRLTGKQLFLADASLVNSDLQILNTTEPEVDESLFEDDIDLSDDGENNL